jgi:hypothetical protein
MKKLRLLLLKECNRNCAGCCNKDWDLDGLPVAQDYSAFDEIYLTGGEPLLRPSLILEAVRDIRRENEDAPIYVYSAHFDMAKMATVWPIVDGFTMTIHEQVDVQDFIEMDNAIKVSHGKSLRLNIFAGIDMDGVDTSKWAVKDGIEWIENCPLPEDETFMRWEAQ